MSTRDRYQRLYVEWHFEQRKDILWAGIPSRDGNRILYAIPLCEMFSSEYHQQEIAPHGRFKNYLSEDQEFKITLDKDDLKVLWPNREQFFYEMGNMVAWVAENCRDEPWSLRATANMMEESVSLHFSFANHVAAIAFKFVWQ